MDKIPMTAEGLKNLEDELRDLKHEERPAVIRAIATAREHGDLKENAEYHAARERQSFIEGRVAELASVVSHAEVIDFKSFTGDIVRFGATVTLADEETDAEKIYQVLGQYEADIKGGIMSVTSPLGRALIGKSLGDSVVINAPGGIRSYEIIKVEYK